MQSCAPVLGSIRSRSYTIFRKAAPPHPGGMPNIPLEVMQEAYSQEVSSAGFWPGSEDFPTRHFLFLHLSAAMKFRQAESVTGAGFLQRGNGRIHPELQRCKTCRKSGTKRCTIFYRVRMKLLQTHRTGTGKNWKDKSE